MSHFGCICSLILVPCSSVCMTTDTTRAVIPSVFWSLFSPTTSNNGNMQSLPDLTCRLCDGKLLSNKSKPPHAKKAHPQASHQKNRKHYKTKRTSSSSAIKQKTGLHFNKRFYKQKTLLSLTREQLSSKKICGAIKNKIGSQSNYHSLLLWDQDQMLKTMK